MNIQDIKNRYEIMGNDPSLKRAVEMAVAIAPTDIAVLVSGESGVGKDVMPRIIHDFSLRKNKKYFAVNCGAIPEGTVDSELFGHEKGSFTSAYEQRKGYFEEADGGTIFLDEVGELPLASQAKLLRVLQSGEFLRVGSSKVLTTDVRVIVATNVNLLNAVAKGRFREDLYYRLSAVTISLPALRERKDDIPLLFRKFVSDFTARFKYARVSLSDDATLLLKNYRFPGNIRQLKNIAESICALESSRDGDPRTINAATLSTYIPKDPPSSLPVLSEAHDQGMSASEKEVIFRTLLQLRSDVEYLKRIIGVEETPTPSPKQIGNSPAPELEYPADEAEDQSSYSSTHSGGELSPQTTLSVKAVSANLILQALEKHSGNRKAAAAELGISERTLYRKLKENDRK